MPIILNRNQLNTVPGNTYSVFVWSQLECQLLLTCASAPFLGRFFPQYPNLPATCISPSQNSNSDNKDGHSSIASQIHTTLPSRIKTHLLHLGGNSPTRPAKISRPLPQAAQIPEWEFATLEIPRQPRSPADEHSYDRYRQGMYGPPAPPKDTREMFEQYRREHGEVV
jgi:hypothetical protein